LKSRRGVGCEVWGFPHFQLVNYPILREKVPEFSPQSLQSLALFDVKKGRGSKKGNFGGESLTNPAIVQTIA